MTDHTQTSKGTTALLVANGAVAGLIGGLVTFAPEQLFALSGITLNTDPNMMSEVRAPGGVLLAAAIFIAAAAYVRSWQAPALALSTLLYLGYAFGRVVAIYTNGLPGVDLLWALGIEAALGALSLLALTAQRDAPAHRAGAFTQSQAAR